MSTDREIGIFFSSTRKWQQFGLNIRVMILLAALSHKKSGGKYFFMTYQLAGILEKNEKVSSELEEKKIFPNYI